MGIAAELWLGYAGKKTIFYCITGKKTIFY